MGKVFRDGYGVQGWIWCSGMGMVFRDGYGVQGCENVHCDTEVTRF
jgi:hypothetical protein